MLLKNKRPYSRIIKLISIIILAIFTTENINIHSYLTNHIYKKVLYSQKENHIKPNNSPGLTKNHNKSNSLELFSKFRAKLGTENINRLIEQAINKQYSSSNLNLRKNIITAFNTLTNLTMQQVLDLIALWHKYIYTKPPGLPGGGKNRENRDKRIKGIEGLFNNALETGNIEEAIKRKEMIRNIYTSWIQKKEEGYEKDKDILKGVVIELEVLRLIRKDKDKVAEIYGEVGNEYNDIGWDWGQGDYAQIADKFKKNKKDLYNFLLEYGKNEEKVKEGETQKKESDKKALAPSSSDQVREPRLQQESPPLLSFPRRRESHNRENTLQKIYEKVKGVNTEKLHVLISEILKREGEYIKGIKYIEKALKLKKDESREDLKESILYKKLENLREIRDVIRMKYEQMLKNVRNRFNEVKKEDFSGIGINVDELLEELITKNKYIEVKEIEEEKIMIVSPKFRDLGGVKKLKTKFKDKQEEIYKILTRLRPTSFISYAWEEENGLNDWVRCELTEDLLKAGIEVWLDYYSLSPGGPLQRHQRRIARADNICVIGTPKFKKKVDEHLEMGEERKTSHIGFEAKIAIYLMIDRGALIIPIIYEGSRRKSLPIEFQPDIYANMTKEGEEYYDFESDPGKYYENMLRIVGRMYERVPRGDRLEMEEIREYIEKKIKEGITPKEKKKLKKWIEDKVIEKGMIEKKFKKLKRIRGERVVSLNDSQKKWGIEYKKRQNDIELLKKLESIKEDVKYIPGMDKKLDKLDDRTEKMEQTGENIKMKVEKLQFDPIELLERLRKNSIKIFENRHDFEKEVLEEFYVDLKGKDRKRDEQDFSLKEEIEKFINNADNEKRLLLLRGEAGGGKSLFAERLAKEKWKKWLKNKNSVIPLFIRLSEITNIEEIVRETLKRMGITEGSDKLIEYMKDRKILFILDGYDELIKQKQINYYNRNKLGIWKQSKVIITCREEHVQDTDKTNFYPRGEERYLQEIYIETFDEKQRKEYIKKYINAFNAFMPLKGEEVVLHTLTQL